MKVLCIDNEYVTLSITVGKWYELADPKIYSEQYRNNTIIVEDDKGRLTRLSRKYFKTVEELREERINKLLQDEECI